ncbi:MAG TPA: DNA polymerase domain-containing protein [Chthoniobacteraceae bacterium]|nr:DNA polymerase domain-containing protein [Chthoniobacteraceae bacterium]
MAFEDNRTLFGYDAEERLVALEPNGPDSIELFRREPDGTLTRRVEPYRPFLWTAGSVPADQVDFQALEGDLPLGFLAVCDDWPTFLQLRNDLKAAGMPHHAPGEPAQHYLLASGKTLFKKLPHVELRRLQLAIETDPEGCIRQVDLADNHGWEATLRDDNERELLQRVTEELLARDPDLIEGHDLFRSVLHQLAGRARRLRLKLPWGRDGSFVSSRSSRLQIAEKTIAYPKYSVYGRHLVDSFVLTQYWDVSARELESYALPHVAEHFRIEGTPTRQVRALVELLGASYFVQASIFPYPFQDVLLRGNATRINTLFLREYLRQGHSIPVPPEVRSFAGGYTDIFFTGIAHNVWHCDVASLYPSVMLRFDLFPASDRLGIFRSMLSDLRRFRLEAKAALRQATQVQEQHSLDALQSAFKILINSFYGYLGFGQGHFADFDTAAKVTEMGRDLLRQMVEWLQEKGAQVIEIDTDGIYFVPPPDATTPAMIETGLTGALPDGIDVECDTTYRAMLSYKAKNYALLTHEGELILRGGGLRSRGLERFQRDFLEEMIRALLEGRPESIAGLLQRYQEEIEARVWPIERLIKTDTLQDSLLQYRRKIEAGSRNRSAPYELALKSGHPYQPGDQVSYYITGTRRTVAAYENSRLASEWDPAARDENVAYYVAKLNDLMRRFSSLIPAEARRGDTLL